MKNDVSVRFLLLVLIFPVILLIVNSCEMPATNFDDLEEAKYCERETKTDAPAPDSSVRVMTWNIRFGIGRGPWFGDACGYKVIYTEEEVLNNLKLVAGRINQVEPDILILQEVDLNSTCSAYVDELKWLLDNTYFNYAVYGSCWKAQYVPSDGLGRMNECNVILSRWPLSDGVRIQLPLSKDQGALYRYFDNRYCIVRAKVQIPGFDDLHVLNLHSAAFTTDETKKLHLEQFKDELDRIDRNGELFVGGGDLNTIPPGSFKTDYCLEDMCEGESFHKAGDDPMHKPGSDYTPEGDWLIPVYNDYQSVVKLSDYIINQEIYFTHTTRPDHSWDRTLDYLFTNSNWEYNFSAVHQNFLAESDHAPVSGVLTLRKKTGKN